MTNNTKAFTRGGQIAFHNLRMLNQINQTIFKWTFMLCLLLTAGITWLITPNTILQTAYDWGLANVIPFLKLLNEQTKPLRVPYQGHNYWVSPHTMLNNTILLHQANEVWHFVMMAAVVSVAVTVVLLYLMARWLTKRGETQTNQQRIRGTEMVAPQVLKNLLLKANKAYRKEHPYFKNTPIFTIADLPMPPEFETRHVLMHGTTGTGKSVLIKQFLDQIREKGDRAIIFDKGCSFTPLYYRENNDKLLNPFDARCVGWDLWAEAKSSADFENMAESLIPSSGESDPFWIHAARTLFATMSFRMKEDPNRSIQKLLRYLLSVDLDELSVLLADTEAASLVSEKAEKTAISIRTVLSTYLKSLKHLIGIEYQADFGFSIRDWIQNENNHNWLFVSSNGEQMASIRPLLSMWMTMASMTLLSLPENPNRRLWLIIDELPSLHKIPFLSETLAEVRKFGGCFVLGMQSYAQLEKTYGRGEAKSIFDLLNTRFFYRSPSSEMAKLVSQELGEQEFEECRENYSYGANRIRDGVSIGQQRMIRPVVSYADIMELKNLNCYLRLPGQYPITKLTLTPKPQKIIADAFVRRGESQDAKLGGEISTEEDNIFASETMQQNILKKYSKPTELKKQLVDRNPFSQMDKVHFDELNIEK